MRTIMNNNFFFYSTFVLSSILIYVLIYSPLIRDVHKWYDIESKVLEIELTTQASHSKACPTMICTTKKCPIKICSTPTCPTKCDIPINSFDTQESEWLFDLEANSEWFPRGEIGNNITGYKHFIVPNIVHYVLLDDNEINFVHYLSFHSLFKVQKPDKIMIHCNCDKIEGKYWNKLKIEYDDIENKVITRRIEKPDSIFAIKFPAKNHLWHSSDVLRNKVLMEFGGIYLDRDVVTLKSLDTFRRFEMTLDYQFDGLYREMGTQVQIAHKRARFLRLYLQTYKKYDGKLWYWNAGQFPTQRIIDRYPHLVHSLKREFGASGLETCPYLYVENANDWKEKYHAIHLLMRGNSIEFSIQWCFGDKLPIVKIFDEENVKRSNTTFGQIARFLLYNN